MRFLAVHRSWLGSDPAALDASDAALGAWLRLAVLAADMELGEGSEDIGEGRIPSCREWSDRAWLRAVGTDCSAVGLVVQAGLARWDKKDLLVGGYDLKGQLVIQAKRAGGKKGGRPKNNHSKTTAKPVQKDSETTMEPNGKDSKTPFPSLPSLSSPSLSSPPHAEDLQLFAVSWGELTGRGDFEDYANGSGMLGGTDHQVLLDFRKACKTNAEFRARVTARLADDENGFWLSQTPLHWAKSTLQAPVVPPTPAKPYDAQRDGPRKNLGAYKILNPRTPRPST